MESVSIGIIGAGRIGKIHTVNIAWMPNTNLVSIAERKEVIDAIRDFVKKLGTPKVTENYQDILNNQEIDAVVICSSTDTHSQIIIEAAKAGKHIFCEKPIDHDLSKIDQALKAVKKAGVKFQVGFNRRFDPNFAQVKQTILEGKVGTPHFIHIISRDPVPPSLDYLKVSGGIFMDMTIHDFDMVRFLIGSEVEELFVYGGVMVDPNIGEIGDIDMALIVLKFKNGVIGTIDNSRQAVYGYDQRVEVFGSGGAIAAENQTPFRTVLSDSKGIHTPKPLYFFMNRYAESYRREMEAFIDAIINDTETPVSGIDGRIPVAMALAAQRSYRERRPIKLSEIKKKEGDVRK